MLIVHGAAPTAVSIEPVTAAALTETSQEFAPRTRAKVFTCGAVMLTWTR